MLLVFHCCGKLPGHNLGNSQVSVNRTIGPTLVEKKTKRTVRCIERIRYVKFISLNHEIDEIMKQYIILL